MTSEREQRLADRASQLIAAVERHAAENYGSGWDVVVECYERDDIREAIGAARTEGGAIAAVARHARIPVSRPRGGRFEVHTADVDGRSVRGFTTRAGAARRFLSMSGHPLPDGVTMARAVSDYGTVVSFVETMEA